MGALRETRHTHRALPCHSLRHGRTAHAGGLPWAARLDDILVLATWIVASDHRLRCTRRFEILRVADGKRVLEAEIDFFSLNLDTGKPCRFPAEFTECYKPMPEVVAAYADLPAASRHIGRWPR